MQGAVTLVTALKLTDVARRRTSNGTPLMLSRGISVRRSTEQVHFYGVFELRNLSQ